MRRTHPDPEVARRRLELLRAELTHELGERVALHSVPDADELEATRDSPATLDSPPWHSPGPSASRAFDDDRIDDWLAATDPALGTPIPRPGLNRRSQRPGRHSRAVGPPGGWLHDRLPESLRDRVRISASQLVVLMLVAAVGLAAAGWFALSSTDGKPVPVAKVSAAPQRAAGLPALPAVAASGGASAAPSAAPGEPVVVDVAGKVRRPGIVRLPAGSRVDDALARAGGPKRGVDLTALNLARVLVDGEQILVGVKGSTPSGVAPAAVGSTPASGGLVNLNTATESELEELPGVGPVTSQKILDWRSAHGAFTSVDELLEVDGIGDKTLAQIAPHATL